MDTLSFKICLKPSKKWPRLPIKEKMWAQDLLKPPNVIFLSTILKAFLCLGRNLFLTVFPHILLQIRDAERKVGLQLPDGPMDEEDAAPMPSDLKPTGHRASHECK